MKSKQAAAKEEPIPPPLPFADPLEPREVPTCRRELLAWWMLSFANEPSSAVALSLSFSVLLEGLTKAIGHKPGLPGTPCDRKGPCVAFNLGSWEVSTSSFSLYVTGIARFVPMVLFVVVGPLADYCCFRKRMLISYTIVGAIASILVLGVFTPSIIK